MPQLTDADKVLRNDTGKRIAAAIESLAAPEADNVSYDNTTSGLSATNAQDALDEINTKANNKAARLYIDKSSLTTNVNDKASWDSAFADIPDGFTGVATIIFKSGYQATATVIKTGTNWGSIQGHTNDDYLSYLYTVASGTSTLHRLMTADNPTGTGKLSMNRKASTQSGEYSVTMGYDCTASGARSIAEGSSTTASGDYSHAEGAGGTASGERSHAEGSSTTASGDYSHAEGSSTTAEGTHSHAEGQSTIARGARAHAEGYGTLASGDRAHAEGTSSTASGNYSHAEGSSTASNNYAHSEGYTNTSSGAGSHSEGGNNTVSGNYAHVEGQSNQVSGDQAHAEGYSNVASGAVSHAEGRSTIANHWAQHVFGAYNTEDPSTAASNMPGNYVEIVGNGTGTAAADRSNARTLDWNGNETLAGGLKLHVNKDAATFNTTGTITASGGTLDCSLYVDGSIIFLYRPAVDKVGIYVKSDTWTRIIPIMSISTVSVSGYVITNNDTEALRGTVIST